MTLGLSPQDHHQKPLWRVYILRGKILYRRQGFWRLKMVNFFIKIRPDLKCKLLSSPSKNRLIILIPPMKGPKKESRKLLRDSALIHPQEKMNLSKLLDFTRICRATKMIFWKLKTNLNSKTSLPNTARNFKFWNLNLTIGSLQIILTSMNLGIGRLRTLKFLMKTTKSH